MCMWRVFLALGTDKSESHSNFQRKIERQESAGNQFEICTRVEIYLKVAIATIRARKKNYEQIYAHKFALLCDAMRR